MIASPEISPLFPRKKAERDQGQVPVSSADIGLILGIIKDPDYAVIGLKRHGVTLIAYAKMYTGWTLIYIDEVLNSRKNKTLRSTTMFKKMGKISMEAFIKILSNNAHTDMRGIKKVVETGGKTGGERDGRPPPFGMGGQDPNKSYR
ncbi:MAG: hypothetical protein LBB78_07815 [Spirochaetaceae bacterium]|nr:hypothetical protein [Spirochaetaceae bacterium]